MNDKIFKKWCYVNTENEFSFAGMDFKIDESVDSYKVHNKSGAKFDYTNEAKMTEILVLITDDKQMSFFDQSYDPLDNSLISLENVRGV